MWDSPDSYITVGARLACDFCQFLVTCAAISFWANHQLSFLLLFLVVISSLLLFLSNFLVFLRLFFLPCFINYRHCQFLFLFLIFQFLIFFVLMSLNSPATSSFLISSFLISSISDFFTLLLLMAFTDGC